MRLHPFARHPSRAPVFDRVASLLGAPSRPPARAILVALASAVLLAGCKLDDSGLVGGDGGSNGGGGVGARCESNDNCRLGLECRVNGCQPTGTGPSGAGCQLTGDCAEGLYCGPSRLCAEAGAGADGTDCDATAECAAGLVCAIEGLSKRCRAAGTSDVGRACTRATDCLAGLTCAPDLSGTMVCQSLAGVPGPDGGLVELPTPPFWAGETCETDDSAPVAYFRVPREGVRQDFYRLPFPNDVRRRDGKLDLEGHPSPGTAAPIDVLGRYLEAAERDLDGFATNPVVYFRFSQPYKWASIGGNIRLVDVTPGSPRYGLDHGLSWLTTNGTVTRYLCPDWLGIRTPHGNPLRPGTTYAVVITNSVVPDVGGTYAREADFTAMLGDAAPGDAALTAAHAAYAPLRAYLADETQTSRPTAESLLVASVFTTQSLDSLPSAVYDAVQAAAAPTVSDLTVCGPGVTSPCDDGTEQRACDAADPAFVELHGRVTLPIFQNGAAPYEDPDDGGGFEREASGALRLVRTEEVCFALTIPRNATPPAAGFPLVIAAHGTGGSFKTAIRSGLAGPLASRTTSAGPLAAATLAIDFPEHGARRGPSTRSPDVLFYNFANPAAARDNVLQGAADLHSLVRFAKTYSGSAPDGPEIRFDPSRIVLFAHSQGANHATVMLANDPDLRAVVLSGNGGDLTQSLLNKREPIDIARILPFALLDADGNGNLQAGDFHPALALFQMYFERADGVNFARLLRQEPREGDAGRHVFMTYGLGDTYSPEPTLQAYALAAALPLVSPLVTDAFGLEEVAPPLMGNVTLADEMPITFGLRQYRPNPGDDGHFVSTRTETGLADTLRFLSESLAGAVPPIGE